MDTEELAPDGKTPLAIWNLATLYGMEIAGWGHDCNARSGITSVNLRYPRTGRLMALSMDVTSKRAILGVEAFKEEEDRRLAIELKRAKEVLDGTEAEASKLQMQLQRARAEYNRLKDL